MKLFKSISVLLILFLGMSCNHRSHVLSREQLMESVMQTEKEFCNLAEEKGLQAAFLAFADSNVVLLRNNQLIKGKQNLAAFYKNFAHPDSNIRLVWKPDFVDVSASGDLAYTYGTYTFSRRDSDGILQTSTGIFHTVWKRQKDGSWKFVWD